MPDFDYVVTAVRDAYRHRTSRKAVLLPLLGKTAPGSFNDLRMIDEAMYQLRQLWHRRIEQMRNAGWLPAQSDKHVQFLRNCPPCGVQTNLYLHECGRSILCPFCYARDYVLKPFLHIEVALFGRIGAPGVPLNPKAPPNRKLIQFHIEETFDGGRKPWGPDWLLGQGGREIRKAIRKSSSNEIREAKADFGSVLYRLHPEVGGLTLTKMAFWW